MMLAAAAVALSAAAPAPVEVVSRNVALPRHDRAPIDVRCHHRRRACRGVLILGLPDCPSEPALDPRCQAELGRRRFAIPPGRTRTVVVPRAPGREHAVTRSDAMGVLATPYLGRRSFARTGARTRWVRLVPPAARPALALELRVAKRLEYGDEAVFFEAATPLGTTRVEGELAGRAFTLHARGSAPYVVGRTSYTVAGTIWHGELLVADGELQTGERHPFRLIGCDPLSCLEERGIIELARDDRYDPRPICDLRPLTAVR